MRANFRAILARGEGSTQWPNFAAQRPIPPNGRMAEAYLSDWESFGPPSLVDVCVLPQKTAVFRKKSKSGLRGLKNSHDRIRGLKERQCKWLAHSSKTCSKIILSEASLKTGSQPAPLVEVRRGSIVES